MKWLCYAYFTPPEESRESPLVVIVGGRSTFHMESAPTRALETGVKGCCLQMEVYRPSLLSYPGIGCTRLTLREGRPQQLLDNDHGRISHQKPAGRRAARVNLWLYAKPKVSLGSKHTGYGTDVQRVCDGELLSLGLCCCYH